MPGAYAYRLLSGGKASQRSGFFRVCEWWEVPGEDPGKHDATSWRCGSFSHGIQVHAAIGSGCGVPPNEIPTPHPDRIAQLLRGTKFPLRPRRVLPYGRAPCRRAMRRGHGEARRFGWQFSLYQSWWSREAKTYRRSQGERCQGTLVSPTFGTWREHHDVTGAGPSASWPAPPCSSLWGWRDGPRSLSPPTPAVLTEGTL
jgi:hypothetical protein